MHKSKFVQENETHENFKDLKYKGITESQSEDQT